MEVVVVDWSNLPPEILESISLRLQTLTDFIRFRAVCHTWQSSTPETPRHLPPQLPWLLHRGVFFDLSTSRFHSLPDDTELSRTTTRWRGSSHGWIIILENSPRIILFNPLSRVRLHLPSLSTMPDMVSFSCNSNILMHDAFVKKVVLSSSPLDRDVVAVASIVSNHDHLVFCRVGDRSWRPIDGLAKFTEDVVYCNGLFYAVDADGAIAVCDFRGGEPRVSLTKPTLEWDMGMYYLVWSNGAMLLAKRLCSSSRDNNQGMVRRRTIRFEIFRLDSSRTQWERVGNLGDKMLFVGENNSLSLSALDFPGCEGNCVYYTDNYSIRYNNHGGKDVGLYRLADGSCQLLPNSDRWSFPIWLTPNPC